MIPTNELGKKKHKTTNNYTNKIIISGESGSDNIEREREQVAELASKSERESEKKKKVAVLISR